jgi:hypothetical protein
MEPRLRIVNKDEENVAMAATMMESEPGLPDRSTPPEPVTVKYEVAGEHARGGIGRVFRAWHRRLNRLVAIKELPAARPRRLGSHTPEEATHRRREETEEVRTEEGNDREPYQCRTRARRWGVSTSPRLGS